MNFVQRLLCRHPSSSWIRNIHGDEINLAGGMRSLWQCKACSRAISKPDIHVPEAAGQPSGRLAQRPSVQLDVLLRLNESEVRALDALVGYGNKAFLEVFYQHMGKHYLQPHEAGLLSLFATIRSDLLPLLNRAEAARTAFALRDPVVRSREDHDAMIARLQGTKP